MDPLPCQVEEILDLEARHDDLLERLADLDQRVARVLADCLGTTRQEAAEEGNSLPAVEVAGLVDRPPEAQAHRDAQPDANDPGH
jgi:hypothetical protein